MSEPNPSARKMGRGTTSFLGEKEKHRHLGSCGKGSRILSKNEFRSQKGDKGGAGERDPKDKSGNAE